MIYLDVFIPVDRQFRQFCFVFLKGFFCRQKHWQKSPEVSGHKCSDRTSCLATQMFDEKFFYNSLADRGNRDPDQSSKEDW